MNTGYTEGDFEALLSKLENAPMPKEYSIYASGKAAWELMGKPMRTVVERKDGKLHISVVPDYPKGTYLFTFTNSAK